MGSPINTPQTLVFEISREPARYRLLVIADGRFSAYPLPSGGSPVIGRSERCDVYINDDSMSRQHARIHMGDQLMVEDLESLNGTMVGDRRIEPGVRVPIAIGEPITLGSVTVLTQRYSGEAKSRLVWAHGHFEERVAEECARSIRSGLGFAVIRIFDESGQGSSSALERAIAASIRPFDVIGEYAPGEYEVILVDAAASDVDSICERMRGSLEQPVRIGVARYPDDGNTADALIANATPRLTVAAGDPAPALTEPVGPMRRTYDIADRVATSNITVLLLGETGVGKEVLARYIHQQSSRSEQTFMGLNCAALSETLLESELFGHERGAFTGAHQAKKGLLEAASTGTMFLDEIGEMPPSIQAKMLRVLEEREVMRVGSLESRSIDVRFIAATNRDLEAEVEAGRFRRDLYFRLNVFPISIPPLRERVDEIESLSYTLLMNACEELQLPKREISAEAMALLRQYRWPGNIRELRNVLQRALVLCTDGEIGLEHLPREKMDQLIVDVVAKPAEQDSSPEQDQERARIIEALEECAGNQTRAAKLLEMPRRTLVYKLKSLDIPRPRKG